MNKKMLALLLCSVLQACTQIDDYLLGKDNTARPSELKPLTASVPVKTNWSVPIGSSYKRSAYSKMRPVVRGDVVFTADSSGMVEAIAVNDQTVRWSHPIGIGLTSGPSVGEGVVVVGTIASTVVVLNQATGKELWQARVSGQIFSTPVIVANKLIVKTLDGNLFAFSLDSGEKLWVSDHGAPILVLKASSSPVVVGDLLLVGFSDGKLDALDMKNGLPVWEKSIAFASGASDVERLVDIDADPIVRNQVAFLATYQGHVGALSLADGQFIWQKPASVYKNMAYSSSTLYFVDSDDTLWAIDSRTGQVNWKQGALEARGLTEPVLWHQYVVVGDSSGFIHLLSTKTGELMGRAQMSGAIYVAPVNASGMLYVQTANGMLNQLSVS